MGPTSGPLSLFPHDLDPLVHAPRAFPTLGLRRLLASPLVEIAVEEVTPLLDVELRARTRFTVDRAAVVGGSPDSVR